MHCIKKSAKLALATAIILFSTLLLAKQAPTSKSSSIAISAAHNVQASKKKMSSKILKKNSKTSRKRSAKTTGKNSEKALTKARPPTMYETSERIVLSAKDTACLTKNVYHEARGEPYAGKLAVAQVTLNRVDSRQWGFSVCHVVYAPSQFSWTADPGKRYKIPSNADWALSQRIVHDYTQGLRVTQLEDAQYFHAKRLGRPHWTKKLKKSAYIGNHVFYE